MSTVQADYEQMLLGRMSLLFLLRGRHGSMLMLDEPETHFNDSWKREIIDIVDLREANAGIDVGVVRNTLVQRQRGHRRWIGRRPLHICLTELYAYAGSSDAIVAEIIRQYREDSAASSQN